MYLDFDFCTKVVGIKRESVLSTFPHLPVLGRLGQTLRFQLCILNPHSRT